MKIIISGYGKMGKTVEQVCLNRKHQITAKLDTIQDWERLETRDTSGAVVIDFSMPKVVVSNLYRCFEMGLPVVTGTTGWYNEIEAVSKRCIQKEGALFYTPNFSLGVNIFFHINKMLAQIMAKANTYRPQIIETHHVHKLDSPSGTALRLAEDILNVNAGLKSWVNSDSDSIEDLSVISKREGEVPGTHEVVYDSEVDRLSLKHEAKSRDGFALGAVMAAEFLQSRKGVFTMSDFLKTLGL